MKFQYDAYAIIRLLIQQIYERNIDQFNQDGYFPRRLKWQVCDFILYQLSNDYIDSLFKDETYVEIKTTDTFRYELFMRIVDSPEFRNFIEAKQCLDSSVYDHITHQEYECEYGEHFLGVLSALSNANITEHQDEYVMKNLTIVGHTRQPDGYVTTQDIAHIKLKPADKVRYVKTYMNDHWIIIPSSDEMAD